MHSLSKSSEGAHRNVGRQHGVIFDAVAERVAAHALVIRITYNCHAYLVCGVRRPISDLTALHDTTALKFIRVNQPLQSDSGRSYGIPCRDSYHELVS
jgi:hypothetical protein